eukprot:TRINITY_DN13864_c0_g1_i1.p1 TRINITY_DN13864_c0_g1~~TRINITY_DN13864_c0_g1_i1.p1  ORF type:complete len:337 (-),score=60.65 TRINITY_DN13864_c0_g1_i1:694-1671(-)
MGCSSSSPPAVEPKKAAEPEVSANPEKPACRFGAMCYNYDPEHRSQFTHPVDKLGDGTVHCRRACKYGAKCFQNNSAHLQEFVHPGDRNYRMGLVVFPADMLPTFETLWQVFQYFDPEESGHLTREEFSGAAGAVFPGPGKDAEFVESAWEDMGGATSGTVNFARFASWAASAGSGLSVGLDRAGAKKPCTCRLQTNDGGRFRCSCVEFKAQPGNPLLCECGHKQSMHRSDTAMGGIESFAPPAGLAWTTDGLVAVSGGEVLSKLQALLDRTHKSTDNWTRDRGCTEHGVGKCALSCATTHRVPVPVGYKLKQAFRNQNYVLWQR